LSQAQSLFVGHDSNRVIEQLSNDKIGILSHEETHAGDQPRQGNDVGQCLTGDVTTLQKAPIKANLEPEQKTESQATKSASAGAKGREQSQSEPEVSAPGVTGVQRTMASEDQGNESPHEAGAPPLRQSDTPGSPGGGQIQIGPRRLPLGMI